MPASQSVICERTQVERDALTVALLADGGPQSLVAGQNLISVLDGGCGASPMKGGSALVAGDRVRFNL